MIGNTITDEITKISRTLSQSNLERVESETESIGFDREIPRKCQVLMSSLYNYRDAYMLVKGTITVANTGTAAAPNNRNK